MVTTKQKTVEVPQIQYVDKEVHIPTQRQRHVPVVKQVEVPQIQTIEKIVEVPFVQTVEKVVEIPTVGNTVQGEQRAVNIQLETVRQVAPAEAHQEVVSGPDLPMETAQPILRALPQEAQQGYPMQTMTYAAPPVATMQMQPQIMAEPVAGVAMPMMTVQGGSVAMQGGSVAMQMGGGSVTVQ